VFITPKTPYTRLVAFLFFRADSAAEAYSELRRRDLGYIYLTLDEVKKDYQAMLSSMPEEVEGWRRFKPAKGALPVPDMNVEAWCDQNGILKFYQQITLARQTPIDNDFMKAWELLSLKGMRASVEAMKLALMSVGQIQENLKGFNTVVDLAILDHYFEHIFSELEMSKDEIWAWVKTLQKFSAENPAFVAEAESKRVALTAPGDLFLIMRKLNVWCNVTVKQMNAEIRLEAFGRFKDACDRHEIDRMPELDFDRFERASGVMKKMADIVDATINTEITQGLTATMRKHLKQETSFLSNRTLRSRQDILDEGMVERKQLPPKGSNN
jgi:hypothetical protein